MTKCPKCNGESLHVRYHTGCFPAWNGRPGTCGKYDNDRVIGEHLHVYCDHCHYDWTEQTLDVSGAVAS